MSEAPSKISHQHSKISEVDLTEAFLEELRDAFSLFDKDDEGTMSTKDLNQIMRSLGYNLLDAEIKDMLKEVDPEDTGVIDFDQFTALALRKINSTDNVSEIRDALRAYDPERTGFITPKDLRETLLDLGEKFNDEEVEEMVREADLNADGLVNYHEFLEMMTSIR
ncbi:EF-hand domain pair domain-containing protein [Phthorimaea operculella]|nr:EF-hand domain pair domain-containing protein [Phthorimaea operculella]